MNRVHTWTHFSYYSYGDFDQSFPVLSCAYNLSILYVFIIIMVYPLRVRMRRRLFGLAFEHNNAVVKSSTKF